MQKKKRKITKELATVTDDLRSLEMTWEEAELVNHGNNGNGKNGNGKMGNGNYGNGKNGNRK